MALRIWGAHLKSCWGGIKQKLCLHWCFLSPHDWGILGSSLVINRGTDLIGMACDVHWTKFVTCLPCIWLGAYDRKMNKARVPTQDPDSLKLSWVPICLVTDGRDTSNLTWRKVLGLNTSWDSALFLTDAMTNSASECMRIYRQNCKNTQAPICYVLKDVLK